MKVTAEGGELILENETGDVAIIPKKYRLEVMGMIEDGCYECIDNLVSTLPVMEDYAQDGTVLPVKVNEPDGTVKEYDRSSPEYRELYNSGNLTNYDAKRDEYVATPLKEVEITATKPKSVGDFFDKYSARMAEEYGSSLAGSLLGVPTLGVLGMPQAAVTYMMDKDKNTLPSKALGIENKAGALAVDVLADPIGAGATVKGAKSIAKALSSRIIKSKIASSVDDVGKNITQTSNADKPTWQMQEIPGLHLKSTMKGEAISKIVEPKTGLINTEQALAIIGKESGGADKVALIRQGLGDNIPKKMDFNEFRKTVQDQLIPLERQFANHSSNYGLNKLGYPSPKRSSFEVAIENNKKIIKDFEDSIASLEKMEQTSDVKNLLNRAKNELADSKLQLDNSLKQMNKLPLENQTLILGNKSKFGRGSSAHGNPEETLGHIHFLRDAEHPNIGIATQIQSDAFQGTHRIMPKDSKNLTALEKQQKSLARMEELQERNKAILNKMKTEGVDEAGLPVQDYQIKQFEDIVKAQENSNIFKKADIENFTQKQLLDKNHQERFLQEFMDYAGKRGDLDYIAFPKPETAAKVQGYSKRPPAQGTAREQELLNELNKSKQALSENPLPETKKVLEKSIKRFEHALKGGYDLEHQTILKKYSEYEKIAKKLGWKTEDITIKGNTYTKIQIPDKFKKGKGEIKAFNIIPPAVGVGAASQLINDKNQE
jgi:hypothetical protein